MKPYLVENFITNSLQEPMFHKLSEFSNEHPRLGRVAVISVAVADVVLGTLKTPLSVIEKLALTIINLLGAVGYAVTKSSSLFTSYESLFTSYKRGLDGKVVKSLQGRLIEDPYTIKDALLNFEWTLVGAVATPIACLMAVPKLIYQLGIGLYNPSNFRSFK